MNVTKEQIDDLNAILKIELATEDYMPKVDASLKTLRKQVTMKGFRQGMVPVSLVKKMHGNSVLYDEVNKIVNEQINTHIQEEKLDVLGQPLPKADAQVNLDIKNPEDVTLEYEMGLVPTFELDALKKGEFTKYEIKVDDKFLNEEIEGLRLRHGVQTYPDDAVLEEKDVLHADVVELENGEVKEGGVSNSTPMGLNIFKKDVIDQFIGKKVGDSIDLNLFESSERDRASILKFILDIKEEGAAPEGMGETFRITISKIGKMQPAEMNDVFFAKLYGEGVVTSEEELKAKLSDEVATYFTRETDAKLKNEIIQYLIDNVEMSFPDAFLKRWIKATNEEPITDEQVESDYENFLKGLRWQLITNKISKDNDIKAEKEDIEEFSKAELKKQLAMYNPNGNPISDEELQTFNASMMAREDHVKKTYEAVMEQKLFEFIKNEVTIEEKEVTLDEFRDLNN